MKRTLFPYFFIIVILSGCASLPKQDNWPQEIPSYDYYLAAYQADSQNSKKQSLEAYLGWVKSFYFGNALYKRGWLKATAEAEEHVIDPTESQRVKEKMLIVGKKVSAEWAKSKTAQRINTKLLGIWGVSLQEALDREEAPAYLDKVIADIDGLLDERIAVNDIEQYHYYPESEDFFY